MESIHGRYGRPNQSNFWTERAAKRFAFKSMSTAIYRWRSAVRDEIARLTVGLAGCKLWVYRRPNGLRRDMEAPMKVITEGVSEAATFRQLENIRYRETSTVRFLTTDAGVAFQYGHAVRDVHDPSDDQIQFGGIWYVHPECTFSELVQRVFLAVQQFEEHELRESFFYKGAAIFSPHLDCEALVKAASGPGGSKIQLGAEAPADTA